MTRSLAAGLIAVTLAVAGVALLTRRGSVESGHDAPVPFPDAAEWKTNFRKHSVNLREIIAGGPPKDGIPAIDRPRFETVREADRWLTRQEPVALVVRSDDARAYPLQILIWHEIVNDLVGGQPVTMTFCPLCNTTIAFDRRLAGRVLDFGTTGKLRFSDLVMYDRQTETWWQQATGEAIVGDLTGRRLTFLPSQIVSWETYRQAYPRGRVLSRNTGYVRAYGSNPYTGYDNVNSTPFLYRGPTDNRLPAMERVVAVSLNGEDVAYPFSVLQKARVVHDVVGRVPIVVFYVEGTRSALDASDIARGRDVGATGTFSPLLEGRRLTFRPADAGFRDRETGTSWNVLGRATAGPLRGRQLKPVISGNHFWFAWSVFKPETRIYRP